MHPQKKDLERKLIARGRKHFELCFGKTGDSAARGKGCHKTYVGPFWKLPESDNRAFYSNQDRTNVGFHAKPHSQVRLHISTN